MTDYIIFHSPSVNIASDAIIKIGRKHIKRVKFVKFLGVLLDGHLSLKYHISKLSTKLARTCGMPFKIGSLLPLDVLLCLYDTLFLSFLQHGLTVWGQTYASYTEPIFRLQRKASSEQSHFSLACLPHFPSLKILNFSNFLTFLN